jgi:hypothetical protein
MSDQTKNQNESKELRIEDLPPKATKPEEEEATKGGYYSGGVGLSGVGILHNTLPQMTKDQSGNEEVDGT